MLPLSMSVAILANARDWTRCACLRSVSLLSSAAWSIRVKLHRVYRVRQEGLAKVGSPSEKLLKPHRSHLGIVRRSLQWSPEWKRQILHSSLLKVKCILTRYLHIVDTLLFFWQWCKRLKLNWGRRTKKRKKERQKGRKKERDGGCK